MSDSKKKFISFQNEAGMLEVSESGTRDVTPENPLVIDYTPAKFDSVNILGGSIYTSTRTAVTIQKLTKTTN